MFEKLQALIGQRCTIMVQHADSYIGLIGILHIDIDTDRYAVFNDHSQCAFGIANVARVNVQLNIIFLQFNSIKRI